MRDYIRNYLIALGMVVAAIVAFASIFAPIVLVGFFGASPWWFMLYLIFVFLLPIPIVVGNY